MIDTLWRMDREFASYPLAVGGKRGAVAESRRGPALEHLVDHRRFRPLQHLHKHLRLHPMSPARIRQELDAWRVSIMHRKGTRERYAVPSVATPLAARADEARKGRRQVPNLTGTRPPPVLEVQ